MAMEIKHTKRVIEIRSVLMGALTEGKSFLIWQRDQDNKIAFQFKAKLDSINAEGVMVFNIVHQLDLDPNKDTFFAIDDSTVVFKTSGVKLELGKLIAPLPEEAKYKERRRHPRKRFKLKDFKQVELNFNFKDEDETDSIISNVLDISESGICFIITKETLAKIDAQENFLINAISSDLGFDVEKGKIMNARKYKGGTLSKGEFYALGVMFV